MPEEAPQFALYVSCVKGRLVSRWDAPSSCFGARISTAQERADGAEPIVWDEECVVPLLASFVARFDRELRNAFRNGDLVQRTAEDHAAWLQLEERREAERNPAPAAEPAAPAPEQPNESASAETGASKSRKKQQ